MAWKIHAKMAAEPTKVLIACDFKNGFGAVRTKRRNRRSQNDGARSWAQSLPTCGQANKKCNQQRGRTLRRAVDQLRSEVDFCRVRARLPVAFALALRMAMKEFDEASEKTRSRVND